MISFKYEAFPTTTKPSSRFGVRPITNIIARAGQRRRALADLLQLRSDGFHQLRGSRGDAGGIAHHSNGFVERGDVLLIDLRDSSVRSAPSRSARRTGLV